MNLRRNLTVAVAFLGMAALPLAAQNKAGGAISPSGHGIKCMAGNTPCTAAQAQDVSRMVVTGRRMHEPLTMIGSVRLGGPDGTLICTQTNGAPCTDEQTAALRDAVAEQSKSPSHVVIVRTIDRATP